MELAKDYIDSIPVERLQHWRVPAPPRVIDYTKEISQQPLFSPFD